MNDDFWKSYLDFGLLLQEKKHSVELDEIKNKNQNISWLSYYISVLFINLVLIYWASVTFITRPWISLFEYSK